MTWRPIDDGITVEISILGILGTSRTSSNSHSQHENILQIPVSDSDASQLSTKREFAERSCRLYDAAPARRSCVAPRSIRSLVALCFHSLVPCVCKVYEIFWCAIMEVYIWTMAIFIFVFKQRSLGPMAWRAILQYITLVILRRPCKWLVGLSTGIP